MVTKLTILVVHVITSLKEIFIQRTDDGVMSLRFATWQFTNVCTETSLVSPRVRTAFMSEKLRLSQPLFASVFLFV